MKKLSLFALLLLAFVATAANAQTHEPSFGVLYTCTYPQGAWEDESNPGWLIFNNFNQVGQTIYGVELYQATIPQGHDNRAIAFAKPVDGPPNPHGNITFTTWEFTRDTIQCKNTVVRNYGRSITYNNCTNGKTRICTY